jgi:hypothetical protein
MIVESSFHVIIPTRRHIDRTVIVGTSLCRPGSRLGLLGQPVSATPRHLHAQSVRPGGITTEPLLAKLSRLPRLLPSEVPRVMALGW